MLLRLFAVVFMGLVQVAALHAAEFTFIDGQADPPGDVDWARDHCNMLMTGEVAAGDTERFEALLAQHANQVVGDPKILGNPRIVTLCPNSPGGSLAEAIKLAEAIRKPRPFPMRKGIPFVATRLEGGARCESACAIVFMSGTIDGFEDPPYPARSMHPTARLGFHAPALTVGDGNYSQRHVNTAFEISIQSIAAILRVLHVGEDESGKSYGGDARWIEASLLEAMLRTPASSMRYVETVDDAGRWDIPVFPIREQSFDYKAGWLACLNQMDWGNQRSSILVVNANYDIGGTERPTRQGELRRLFFTISEFDGDYCEISLRKGGWLNIDTSPDLSNINSGRLLTEEDKARQDKPRPTLLLLMPDTRLASLAPEGEVLDSAAPPQTPPSSPSSPSSPSGWTPRFGGDKVTLSDHNGSQMAWESKGTQRWIWYYAPRPGLSGSGVVSGTLLFEKTSA